MLRRVLFTALVLTPWASWGAGEGESASLPWAAIPTPGTIISLVEEADATRLPTVTLLNGRASLRAHGSDDQRLLVRLGDIVISVQEGHILIDQNEDGCFVVVVAGFALVRDSRSKDRGILLQSRQGIAAKSDGTLADVLTFTRVPRVEDPEPLALQALAEVDEQGWPMDVAPIEHSGIQEPAPPVIITAMEEPPTSAVGDSPAALGQDDAEPSEAPSSTATEAHPEAQAAEPPPAPVSDAPLFPPANSPPISAPRPPHLPAWMQRGRR